jgi:predicted NAD/FAD-dependent oxidoreductase
MNKPQNRRTFLTQSATVLSGAAVTSLLGGCSTFDEYFFDDKGQLSDEVVIIGGGISGLYLAQLLRQKRMDFRLFEAGVNFGGRIKSFNGQDYGASVLKKSDVLANKLIDELKLKRIWLDKTNFCLEDGMQSCVNQMKERILGLLPYRNFRLRWRLIEIAQLESGYELTFERPEGQKKLRCRHVVMTLPPSQWPTVRGLLELPAMAQAKAALEQIQIENVIRLILPTSAVPSNIKPLAIVNSDNLQFRQVLKKRSTGSHIEIDIQHRSNISFSIDYAYNDLKSKMQVNYPFQRMTTDQFIDWQQVSYIGGAYFKLSKPVLNDRQSAFQLIGDSVSQEAPNTIEGALQSAFLAAQVFV